MTPGVESLSTSTPKVFGVEDDHLAGLMSEALAANLGATVLCVGDDFGKTDVAVVDLT